MDITNTVFYRNQCEDALNIIRSEFSLTESKFDFTFGDALHPLHEILFVVIDDMIAAMGLREFGFGWAADGADHGGAELLHPLASDQADTAGGGVE